jgi:hypothetical protein
MGDFFGTIYSWFQSLWCDNLNLYLWGYEPATQSYSGTNIYNIAGLVTVIVALVVVLVYYYIINHPRWCKWWSWPITLLLNSVVGLFVAFGMSYSKYINGYIPQELVYQFDEDGNVIAHLITSLDCWGFGIGGAIVSALFFIVFTFVFKWWSTNAKHVPFL